MKRLTALILTVALCLGLCSFSVAATDGVALSVTTQSNGNAEVKPQAIISAPITVKETYSGSCGSNLTWTLDTETGVLDITGAGNMKSFYPSAPWYSYRSSIKTVNIADSVTSIGEGAFDSCNSLTSITIPDSVTFIGNAAFYSCSSLTSIIIPDSVTSIGSYAFSNCTSLTSITIPDSVTSIGDEAFAYCSSLTSITIPDSVTSIGNGAFFGCSSLEGITIPDSVASIGSSAFWGCSSLVSFNVDNANENYASVDGVLFNKGKTEIICYPSEKNNSSYTVPDSVTSIGDQAFVDCSSLTSITIPDSVTSIGSYAFSGCTSLTSITIPDSVNSIGAGAFFGCSSLTSITIGGSVTSIGEWAFYSCDALTSITIPDSVTSIGDYAFYGCTALETVYYTGSEAKWNAISIGSYNDDLTSANIIFNYVPEADEEPSESAEESSETEEPEKIIGVYTTEKSLSVKNGDSMWLGFGLIDAETGLAEENWKKMAVVVSDQTIISLSDYEEAEYGYSLKVTGKKEGATNVTITDTESGVSTVIVISVYDSYAKTYSYAIDDMAVFYPQNKWEDHIATNIYNLSGMYVNNYQCTKVGDKYKVEFDVYNSRYYAGAVDIYTEDGMWIGYEEIAKFSDISSLKDTLVQAFWLISDAIALIPGGNESNILAYTHAAFSKHTHISLELSEGEYFTISNNVSNSPGTFFINSFEILVDGAFSALDLFTSGVSKDNLVSTFKAEAKKSLAQRLIDARNESLKNEVKKQAQKIMLGTMRSEINKITTNFMSLEAKDKLTATDEACSAMASLAENLLKSYNIEWKHLLDIAAGLGESAFTTFAGPAGVALEGCFAITDATNSLLMVSQMALSSNNPYATVYSAIEEGYINPHGVVINTEGNMDAEAVLQVFKVSESDTMEAILDSDNPLEKYEQYNICFVKDDRLVQPNGKVTVRIPIPEGMKGSTCKVYRQEADGSWTILDAHVEGNYLVFETDHFSLYSVVGDMESLSVYSLPDKVVYADNDTLDTAGLVLDLNEELIYEGFICDPIVLSGTGEHEITVTYGNATTSFNVTVEESEESSEDVESSESVEESSDVSDESGEESEVSEDESSNEEESVVCGDVNGDGTTDNLDAAFILRYDVGLEVIDEHQLAVGDVNGDGEADSLDASKILKYDAGLITEF